MKCQNHPEKDASGACVGCGKLFCADCLIELHGRNYCHKCVETLMDEKDKAIDKAESKSPNVFMNAGGGGGGGAAAAASSGSRNVPPYPRNSVLLHIILFFCTCGIGNIIYWLYVRSRQKEWEIRYSNR